MLIEQFNRTRDLPACSIVPQPTMLPRAPVKWFYGIKWRTAWATSCNMCHGVRWDSIRCVGHWLAYCTSPRCSQCTMGRGNWSTGRSPAPLLLCPPQIPHDVNCFRTRADAVGCRRLTPWATARPHSAVTEYYSLSQAWMMNHLGGDPASETSCFK
jgi:hypothetical protein